MINQAQRVPQARDEARDAWEEALDWHTHFMEAGAAEQQRKRPAWLRWKSDPENSCIFEELAMILDLGSSARQRPLGWRPR